MKKNSNAKLYLIDPRSIWNLWKTLHIFTGIHIRRNPPSSGFIGESMATSYLLRIIDECKREIKKESEMEKNEKLPGIPRPHSVEDTESFYVSIHCDGYFLLISSTSSFHSSLGNFLSISYIRYDSIVAHRSSTFIAVLRLRRYRRIYTVDQTQWTMPLLR